MPKGHKITISDDVLIKEYLKDKLTFDQIALKHRIGHETVRTHINNAAIKSRARGFSSVKMLPTIETSHLTEAQKGYLAGFLDGEGSISLSKRRKDHIHPNVTFSNTHKPTILFLKKLLGLGKISCHERKNSFHKPGFTYTIWGLANVCKLLTVLFPYLVTKRQRAKLTITFCQLRLKSWQKGIGDLTKQQLALCTEVSMLNRRGRYPAQ